MSFDLTDLQWIRSSTFSLSRTYILWILKKVFAPLFYSKKSLVHFLFKNVNTRVHRYSLFQKLTPSQGRVFEPKNCTQHLPLQRLPSRPSFALPRICPTFLGLFLPKVYGCCATGLLDSLFSSKYVSNSLSTGFSRSLFNFSWIDNYGLTSIGRH